MIHEEITYIRELFMDYGDLLLSDKSKSNKEVNNNIYSQNLINLY